MNHGSLFTGLGGWNIASDKMGWETVFNCEIDNFCQRVLKYYWPKAELYEDIKKTDFSKWKGRIDILTNSFPCQGFSVAGKRKGTEDNRYLWPESLRAIKEIQPTWVISENVHGIINIEGGMVFEQVHADMEAQGYEVFTYVLPACGVNAPHRRDRVWFVAYCKSRESGKQKAGNWRKSIERGSEEIGKITPDNPNTRIKGMRKGKDEVYESTTSPDTSNIGHESSGGTRSGRSGFENSNKSIITNPRLLGQAISKEQATGIEQCDKRDVADTKEQGHKGTITKRTASERGRTLQHTGFEGFPTQSPLCSRNDEFSSRLDGIAFPKWRNESIKAYGNAIVPNVALQIFKAIDSIIKSTNNEQNKC